MQKLEYKLSNIEVFVNKLTERQRNDLLVDLIKFSYRKGIILNKNIENIINLFFNKYEVNGILTFEELNRNGRFQKLIKEIGKEMILHSKISKYDFLQRMQELGYKENLLFDYFLYEGFEIKKKTSENPKELNEALDYFGKGTFNSYFDNAFNDSIYRISQTILGITKDTGSTFNKFLNAVKEKIKSYTKRVNNIFYNEANKAFNIRDLKRMDEAEKLGLKFKKTWLSTLDYKTRPDHVKLDKSVADKDGYFFVSGYKTKAPKLFGIAKEDVNCRCTTLAVFEDLVYRDRIENIGKKKIINNTSYEEWIKTRS